MRKNWGIARRGAGRGPGFWAGAASALVLGLVLLVGNEPGAQRLASAMPRPARAPAAASARPVKLGPTDPARAITISLSLAGRSQADLQRTLDAINDPRSPEYHHYLSSEDYALRFGPARADAARVASALAGAGLRVEGGQPAGTLLKASGTVAQVEALFGVRLDDYRTGDGETYFAPAAGPRIPAALQDIVTGVLGLDTRPMFHRAAVRATRPTPQLLEPKGPHSIGTLDIGYDITPLKQAGLDGSGQTLAFAEIDTFRQSDIDAYDAYYGLSTSPVEVVKVNGGARAAKDVSETTLDIEVVHAIAPRAKLIAYGSPADFGSLLQNFDAIVRDNRAQVMSVSLGGCEDAIANAGSQGTQFLQALSQVFQQAASQGMSVFVASGDTGAYTCSQGDPSNADVSVSIPADNPWVTAVGGTALFLNADGSYGYEAGWEGPLEGSGGGGGVSIAYTRPDWQTGPGVDNRSSSGRRQLPDVAAAADPLTGYRIYDSTYQCSGGDCWGAVGGTSAAAPLWAAITTLANQQAGKSGKKALGFLNPTLYSMGRGEFGPSPFHDVTMGGNLYYDAASGWDYSTGWGTPDANLVVRQLVASR